MSQLRGSDVVSIQSTAEFDDLDHLPLISRRKLLLASTRTSATRIHAIVENEEEDYECLLSLPSVSSVGRGMDQQSVLKQSPDSEAPSGVTSEVCDNQILKTSVADDPYLQKTPCGEVMDTSMPTCSDLITYIGLSTDDDGLERVDGSVCPSYKNTVLLDVSAKLKVEISDDNVLRTVGNGVNEFVGVDALEDKVNTNYPDASADDDLDHILLKERLWMLLERRGLQMGKQAVEDSAAGFSEDLMGPCGVRIKEEAQSVDVDASIIGSDSDEVLERKNSKDGVSSVNAASNTSSGESTLTANQYSEVPDKSLVLEAPKSRKCIGKCDMMCPSERPFVESKSCNVQCDVQHRSSGMHALTLQTFHDVKVEPVENGELNYSEKNASSTSSIKTQVKKEMEIPNEPDEDGVDHMRLQDRMKMQTLREDSELDFSSDVVYLSKTVHPSLQYPEPDKSIRMGQPRKRKKTATDKVETALEEDAPGLLQVLLDQGVSVDEIKLYGEPEGEDLIDETFCEEGFSELEAVMSKLFFQRNSVLKFASIRCAKDSKPSYCLGCLFSLVEQARYLQFRKWPVEWGWCRDLQSFIFVFKRHNRIVLERPEYGYATYFFELINSLPIDWQIKRLVTAMKLTNCGRVNIIENKSLLVGEDVTEGEAKVLIGFGWAPNTGLGTMLNYCDRVFHDRKNEKNISEWRSKIGKLLIDGYNGGTIVSTNIADDVIKCRDADSPQFKLEL